VLLAALPLAAATQQAAADNGSGSRPDSQWRSLWVDTFHNGIYNPQQVDKLVADAKAMKVNALIVQVGRWMDCYCNRSTFPRTNVAIAPAPYDPLDYVIEKAHAQGIEVHAWLNATPIWNTTAPPPQPDHIFHSHGETATGADRWLNKRVDGSEIGGATMRNLDITNAAAVDYMIRGYQSIVREYDVDGINLDYIRFPDYNSVNYQSDWGYSDVSLARFAAATGRTDRPAPTDAQFSQWRRDQVTAYVRKIYLSIYEIDPKARLSINGITYWYGPQTEGGWEKTRTYSEVLQDWRAWLSEGIIDSVIAMNYKRNSLPEQQQMYDEWNEILADNQFRRQNVVGPAVYLNTVEDSVVQARKALEPSAAGNRVVGWSGYSYAVASTVANTDGTKADAERAALTAALTTTDPAGETPLFAADARVPDMPWKSRPTRGHLVGKLLLTNNTALDQVPVELTNLRTGRKVTGRVTDGAGWFGFVDLEPGKWLVKAKLPRGVHGDATEVVEVRKGKIAKPHLGPFRSR
jgi:uncharacterized lipoprotein YddW (UPF0748 family)